MQLKTLLRQNLLFRSCAQEQLDDLLLPWRIELQLDHLITHEGLRQHIKRAGAVVWQRPQTQGAG
jgi:hypothetical protein